MAALFERRMRNLISLIVRSVDFAIRAHCCAIYRDRARSTHTAGLKTALFVFLTKYGKSGSAVAFPLPQRRHFVPGTWSFPPDRVPLCGHRHEGDPMPSGANDEAAVAEFIRKRGITRCPTACVLPTQGSIAAADRAALAEYAMARDRVRQAKVAAHTQFWAAATHRNKRGIPPSVPRLR